MLNILIINGSGAIGSSIIEELQNLDVNLIITSSSGEKVHGQDTIKWRYNGSSSVDDLYAIIKNNHDSIDSVVNCLGSIYQVFISTEIQPLYWVSEGAVKRAFGLFDNPNLLATGLMMVTFVAYKFWRDRGSTVLPLIFLIITLILTT